MAILVVCAAGASSSFLVHWMRRVAASSGLSLQLRATALDVLAEQLATGDVVLVGSHLGDRFPEIVALAQTRGSRAVLMPIVSFDAIGAGVALDLLEPMRREADNNWSTDNA